MIALLVGLAATLLLLLGCTAVLVVVGRLPHRDRTTDVAVTVALLASGLTLLALSTHLSA
ncbi:hypothetical protein [Aeromicrobium sp. Leaf291]|uniref:hypothetical protein n=1 Tax=Aeromicrobium sp. Leaf291 TaxID=1736325 RepID=UPI0006FE5C5E|nr:hypothetical protein [Aeromicrobium sp. Leaf291]KQP81613.1 hypothetical protein ASF35_16410 [Aeromicrobium sp. Leaf291]